MSTALGDLENIVLDGLQQPGANFGGYPNWAALNNPQIGQANVDYQINEGYKRICTTLYDLRLTTGQFTLTSSTGVGSYPIPPNIFPPYPQMMGGKVFDVVYLPLGATSSIRFEPGNNLVSWEEFMRFTGQGYLRANSSGLYPRICAVGPQRNTLEFYPNPLENGDTITVTYPARPTSQSTQLPTLVAQSDTIMLPDDAGPGIAYWAIYRLNFRNNATEDAKFYRQLHLEEIARLRELYRSTSFGDVQQFTGDATFPVYSGVIPADGY